MVAGRTRLLLAVNALAACTPALKPGSDRLDAGRADVVSPRPDVSADVSADTGRPDATRADVPADVSVPSSRQTSCPDPSERGCGVVEVAGGTFSMGVSDGRLVTDGSPVQPGITVSSFAVDAYEVTLARFRRFWAAARTVPLLTTVRYPGGNLPVAQGVREPQTPVDDPGCNWTAAPGQRELHPVNCIDWYTAMAFCAWDGGRLPTDAEWEFVARGRDVGGLQPGRLYPWGDEDISRDCDRARWNLTGCMGEDGAETRRVGSFAPSPELDGARVYDLSGNVFEWTADNYAAYNNSDGRGCWGSAPGGRTNPLCLFNPRGPRTIRGGSWYFSTIEVLRAPSRFGIEVDGTLPLVGVGIRCARSR